MKNVNKHYYNSIKDIDRNPFSESDLEALEFSWDSFNHLEQYDLAGLTHEYPEWKKYEVALSAKCVSRVSMSYKDFLKDPINPSPAYIHCYELTKEESSDRIEQLQEFQEIEALWS